MTTDHLSSHLKEQVKCMYWKIYRKLLDLIIKGWCICWHSQDTYQTYNRVQVQQFGLRPQDRPLLCCHAQPDRSARPTDCTPASSRKSQEIADGHMVLSSAQRPSGGLFDNQFGSEEGKTHKSNLEKYKTTIKVSEMFRNLLY